MTGKSRDGADPGKGKPDASDEELEEVQCENECNAGFKVLIGQTIVVLVCLRCRLEYELSQEIRGSIS
jgi:hypothetical protein